MLETCTKQVSADEHNVCENKFVEKLQSDTADFFRVYYLFILNNSKMLYNNGMKKN